MGGSKRMMEEDENQRDAALGVAITAGVLQTCELHPGSVFDAGEAIESAYELGNAQFAAGEFEGLFETQREMTEAITEVVNENMADECSCCADLWEKD